MVKSSTGKVDSLVIYSGTSSFVGTEEVLQTTTITNDNNTISKLAADNTCNLPEDSCWHLYGIDIACQ